MLNDGLMSPSKPYDVTSSTDSLPEFAAISNSASSAVLALPDKVMLHDTDIDEDDDDEEDEDDEEFEEDEGPDTAPDDDNDVSMLDPGAAEHEAKVEETNKERESLRMEKKQSMVFKKQLLKETKHHSKQMQLIAGEQVTRERSQRLKSEKYNREIDKTQRDIRHLQAMFKQLCQQRQKDVGKQAFYEKQLDSLNNELEDAHRQGKAYEVWS